MRPPQDKLSQRQLVYELAAAIDLCMSAAPSQGAARLRDANLHVLLTENPRSAFSTHVLHNIGPRRARWLREYREAARARWLREYREAARARAGVAKSSGATRS